MFEWVFVDILKYAKVELLFIWLLSAQWTAHHAWSLTYLRGKSGTDSFVALLEASNDSKSAGGQFLATSERKKLQKNQQEVQHPSKI